MENTIINTETINNHALPHNIYYTPKQLKLPLILEEIIDCNDPVYTLEYLMEGFDYKKHLVSDEKKDSRGRRGYNKEALLKVILFGFMIKGYVSTRELEDLCHNDIRFRYLLSNEKNYPSHMTISNFMNEYLLNSAEDLFKDFMNYVAKKENIDLEHSYLDGTKIEANANKYTWVWKKACLTNRDKLFIKITKLFEEINKEICFQGIKFGTREVYDINYLSDVFENYKKITKIDIASFVSGKGARKTSSQRYYELLNEYLEKLKEYATKIEICGENRNSYSKTDSDATFMRIKTDYMGNDQLLPAYNVQICVNDEYITAIDAFQFASDMDCFIPMMDLYKSMYNVYPKYPVADAGYGSYNNYLFCEKNGMHKYMKFPMYKKETEDEKYSNDPFRIKNFKKDAEGNLICPNNKKLIKIGERDVKGNKFGRTEEIYECEDCSNCQHKSSCTKSQGNRKFNLNSELTNFHQEVISNLNSIKGSLLRMNRSIQAEGSFGIVKYNRDYTRIVRKGLNKVRMELLLLSFGYNLYKYHNKQKKRNLIK